jgi:arylsulfatase A-like enzyme
MDQGNKTGTLPVAVIKHVVYVSIVFSAIASVADIVGIALVNHELGDLSEILRLFIGITLLTFLPYVVYLGIVRMIVRPLEKPSIFSKRLALPVFYCLGLLPIDLLVARDLSVYFALSANPGSHVKFFMLRPDLLILVIAVSWIVGIAVGITGTESRRRSQVSVKRPTRIRTAMLVAASVVILAILYLPVLLHGPSTTGTAPSNAPLTGRRANVVVISIDTLRSDELGCYGSKGAKTPNIDKIAGKSMVFDNAVTPIPVTGPSHMSMMTGLQPDRVAGHGITSNGNPLSDKIPTLATVLDSAGYETGAVIGGLPLTREYSGLERGFHYYNDIFEDTINTVFFSGFLRLTSVFRISQIIMRSVRIIPPNLKKPGNIVTDQAIGWLGDHASNPFFLFVHYYDPHTPIDPPVPFDSMYSPEEAWRQQPAPHPSIFEDWKAGSPEINMVLAEKRASYRGEVTYADREVGRLIDWGEERGLWDNTLLIITADHGEGFDIDYYGHINRLYESLVRIPMIIHDPRSPGETSQLRSDRLVNIADIFFTVLSFLKVEPPESAVQASAKSVGSIVGWDHDLTEFNRPDVISGEHQFGWGFVGMFTQGTRGTPDVDIGRIFALRFPDWKLIYAPDAQSYYDEYTCFDISHDPYETVNAFNVWDWKAAGHVLVPEALKEWASTQSLDKSGVNVASNDPQVTDSLRALGYLQ